MICFFSRCVRCSSTGMASPARAAKKKWGEKLHYRTFIILARLPRYR